ncbi:DNA phosphorothioation-dependent restriction protein DptF [Staphylococcus capitis]|uniref:DNA phosphorothioation-dependent restriction protein DptF n=2 Tax=Staphylococcus capitis TaxID=29388 RepID=UPI001B7D4E4B|nr:DNA phosphorothioation-dependent restriction protein DptF [Staphylococcus capitis]MCC3743620.1 DNA phosphorothioation-dependent restriction protein DptF [Staphylococcus capitis]MDS0929784.1 DNA phosphorothioation-dependent restriction protein DptF [Staphylococcus capitis]
MGEKQFFEVAKSYGIDVNNKTIKDINVKDLTGQIMKLKFRKEIKNTEYELLMQIKSIISDIQIYDDDVSKMNLKTYVEYLNNYNNKKSDNTGTQFLNIISNISSSSKTSIVHSEEFNEINEYLHVKRPIEEYLYNALEDLKGKDRGIIFLVGSVGDGKSHLLSYFNKMHPHLLSDVYIYNDATESDNPYKTAVETLADKLENFDKRRLNKIVIAINIGMLHNLREYLLEQNIDYEIIEAINQSNIFSTEGMVKNKYIENDVTVLSFLNERNFYIENGEVYSEFYNKIFEKICSVDESNPFYKSFIQDDGFNRNEPVYQNYQLILNKEIQQAIIHLLIKIQIENKRIISTRALLNLIHDIIVPDNGMRENDSFLVNLLFNNYDKSTLLSSINLQDPIAIQDSHLDALNIEIYNALNLQLKCKELFSEEDFKKIQNYLYLLDGLTHKRKFQMIVRLHYLFNYKKYESNSFFKYINLVENVNDSSKLKKDILNKIIQTIYQWKGSPKKGFIYNESLKPSTRIRIGLKFEPKVLKVEVTNKLTINFIFEIQSKEYQIEVDYILYLLMLKIENGYVLKEKDKLETVMFSEFVDNIINNLESNKETIINIPSTNETYSLSEGFLGYQIEEV